MVPVTDGSPILRLNRATLAEGERSLRERDRRLAGWMDRVGPVGLRRQRQRFNSLCCSIISQQLAGKAARTIYRRFSELFDDGRPRPDALLALSDSALRGCGLSRMKVRFLRSLATEFDSGALRNARLGALSDDEVIRRLTRIDGIGVWTAEMFLIFSLGRPDVFSIGDLGLRTGVQRVERRDLDNKQIVSVARRWSPYRTVASLYLWKIAHWKESDGTDGR